VHVLILYVLYQLYANATAYIPIGMYAVPTLLLYHSKYRRDNKLVQNKTENN